MEAKHDLTAAQVLYRRVLVRYSNRDFAYYVDQANEALTGLSVTATTVVASYPNSISSP